MNAALLTAEPMKHYYYTEEMLESDISSQIY